MGLIKNVHLNSGISLTGAYARIRYVGGNKETMGICLDYYVSQETFVQGSEVAKEESYNFPPDLGESSENFIKQGYEYLKTLPDFSSAVDV